MTSFTTLCVTDFIILLFFVLTSQNNLDYYQVNGNDSHLPPVNGWKPCDKGVGPTIYVDGDAQQMNEDYNTQPQQQQQQRTLTDAERKQRLLYIQQQYQLQQQQ